MAKGPIVRVPGTLPIVMALALLPVHVPAQNPAPQLSRQSALTLEQQGKLAQAETAWRSFLRTHPSDPEPYAHLGLLEARQERYAQAVPLYRKGLALNPAFPGLRLNLGLALFKSGEMKEAIAEFNTLLRAAPPNSPEAQRFTILLGMAHYGLGEYAAAVPLLRKAAAADPQNLPLRLSLAHSCLWSKQYQCVLDVYHDMLLLNAESAEVDMLAGEASDEMNDRGGAVDQFRAAVKANPQTPNVHFGLGYLLWKQRQLAEAAAEFRSELALDPTHLQATLYLGDTLLQLNRPEEAKPLLLTCAQLGPSLWLAHLDLGIIDADAGLKEEAVREMEMAAKLKPDEVNVHWRLGRLYRSMGRPQEAKMELDKANSLTRSVDESLIRKISGPASPASPEPKAAPATSPNP